MFSGKNANFSAGNGKICNGFFDRRKIPMAYFSIAYGISAASFLVSKRSEFFSAIVKDFTQNGGIALVPVNNGKGCKVPSDPVRF